MAEERDDGLRAGQAIEGFKTEQGDQIRDRLLRLLLTACPA